MKEGSEVQSISSVNGYGVTSMVEKYVPDEYICSGRWRIHRTAESGNGKGMDWRNRKLFACKKRRRHYLNGGYRCSPWGRGKY